MTTKPQKEESLDHSGAHGAEPSGSTVVFTDITEAPWSRCTRRLRLRS